MQWLYRWLGSKISDSQKESYFEELNPSVIVGAQTKPSSRMNRIRESDELATEPIQFKMFKASGGWAVEFRQYDRRNDKVDTNLYVFSDEQELGKSISQIITMEALKR